MDVLVGSELSVARQTLIIGDAFSNVISFLKTLTGRDSEINIF